MRARDISSGGVGVGSSNAPPPIVEGGIGIKKAGVEHDVFANMSRIDLSNRFLFFVGLALTSVVWRFFSASHMAILFSRITAAAFFILSSTACFSPSTQNLYIKLLPNFLPYKKQLVVLNGLLLAVFGAGLLVPAGWGVRTISSTMLMGLLAFNTIGLVKLCISRETQRATGTTTRAAWIRLAIQGLFFAWLFVSAYTPAATAFESISKMMKWNKYA